MKIFGRTLSLTLLVVAGVLALSACKDGNVRDTGYPGGGNDGHGGHSHYSDSRVGTTR